MGQCGRFWSGVLHLRSAWLLPPDKERREEAGLQSTAAPAGGAGLCGGGGAKDAKDLASFRRESFILNAD